MLSNKQYNFKAKFNPVDADEDGIVGVLSTILNSPGKEQTVSKVFEGYESSLLSNFYESYLQCDGFTLGMPVFPSNLEKIPLLRQLSIKELIGLKKAYEQGGEYSWVIDLNKSRSLYRVKDRWYPFALINAGPSCLTIFLDGEHAGKVFYLCPQPHFNILKPIAKSYDLLVERINKDPIRFFNKIRAYITVRGNDGSRYGYNLVEMIEDN
jgi:hypothetical protein